MSMKGRSALVTGGSIGIGLGIARSLGAAGARIAIAARDAGRVTVAAESLRREGIEAIGLVADVSRGADVERLIGEVADAHGGLDILCLNAGIYPMERIEDLSEDGWDAVLAINLRSNFLCVQKALPLLRRSAAARVVLTSSITGPITGIAGLTHYGASKAAQLGFMRSLAVELAGDAITVNAVLPGTIATEALAGLGPDFLSAAAASIPLGRIGSVEDISYAVCFLASAEAGFITGQTLIVDGGQTLPESKAA